MPDNFPWQTHTVFGAGLIGCYLGAVLTHLGFNTQLIGRAATQAKLKNGIKLTDYHGHICQLPSLEIYTPAQLLNKHLTHEGPKCPTKFLWLTVKCTGIKQACIDMAPLVDEHTVIFCCQNGLGSERLVKQAFPVNKVVRVMVPFNVSELAAAHYHLGSEGKMTLEVNQQSRAEISALVMALNSELLPLSISDKMDALLWAKLQLNLGNSVNALADIPVKAMLEQRGYRVAIALLMQELLQVAKALNLNLPKLTAVPAALLPWVLSLPNVLFTRVANKMLAIDPNVRSSMWWDLSQGKTTEIDFLNGAIIEQAKLLGLACPVNERMCKLIQQVSAKGQVTKNNPSPISAKDLVKLLKSHQYST
ncbi:2-dehydropantoate 2-reductase [Paraglaciecola aestuariivivens]